MKVTRMVDHDITGHAEDREIETGLVRIMAIDDKGEERAFMEITIDKAYPNCICVRGIETFFSDGKAYGARLAIVPEVSNSIRLTLGDNE